MILRLPCPPSFPGPTFGLAVYQLSVYVCKNSRRCRFLKARSRRNRKVLLLAILDVFYNATQILSLEPNSITYGSDTSDGKVGNGERGQTLERGELTLAPGFG